MPSRPRGLPATSLACPPGLEAWEEGERRSSASQKRTEPARMPTGLSVRVGGPEVPEGWCSKWTEEGTRAGYATVRGRLKGADVRSEGRRRVPGLGRSLIGAVHGLVRPEDSGLGPEGGAPNPHLGTAPRSLSGLGIYVSTCSASDPTRHHKERNWARMRACPKNPPVRIANRAWKC